MAGSWTSPCCPRRPCRGCCPRTSGTPRSSSSRACTALAPSCGATTRRRGPCAARRETSRLWRRRMCRLAAREQRCMLRAMNENVIVSTFSEDSRAYEALARLKELAADEQIDLHDGAVVARAEDGTLRLRDAEGNEDEGLATLTGGTVGLLIGILAGPLGVLLGGAIGLLAGAIVDAEDDEETDSVLEHISRSIGNGETAVLADLDESGPAPVDAAMATLDGRVTRYVR